MSEKLTSRPGRWTRPLVALVIVMLANSAYLVVVRRLPGPPRTEIEAGIFLANVILHLVGGLLLFVPLNLLARVFLRSQGGTAACSSRWSWVAERLTGWVSLGSLTVSVLSGLYLMAVGNTRPQRPFMLTHSWAAGVAVVATAAYLALRARRADAAQFDRLAWRIARPMVPVALIVPIVILGILTTVSAPAVTIHNPALPPPTMYQEGGGRGGSQFWPASVQSVGQRFFPREYFIDSKSCGAVGCHPDIYKQWNESAHHFSSFNNQWYRKSIEYMQEVAGTEPSKWCGGCHDMGILLTEKPGTGKPRMDFPIKNQIWPPDQFPEAHAGIGCATCHSVVHVDSTMGNSDYTLDYPPLHKYVITNNPWLKNVYNFLITRAPEPHKKTFLKPFHREETARFCSACHKVHLDQPVNHYRWTRGFNEYDAWQQSGVSGFGARSFYYPADDNGRPAFKKCADCHMPLTASKDAGNLGGWIHSHRFPAANTALPFVNHFPDQMAAVQKMLQDKALTVDIFAIRRQGPAKGPGGAPPRGAGHRREAVVEGGPDQGPGKTQNPRSRIQNGAAPRASSLTGEGEAGQGIAAAVPESGPETVIAPAATAALKPGEEVLVDVVVRTRKIGHSFPGGTFDAFDVWVELKAVDDRGRVVFWSGNLESPDGPVDRRAHFYRALLLDGHANPINKRNAWAARDRLYAHLIPPGAADTIHYRLRVPKDCGPRLTLTAKVKYRKFSWWNNQFAFAGRPVMKGRPDYGQDGSLPGVGLATKSNSGPVAYDYDDRPMRFDQDLSRVSAPDKVVPKLPITVLSVATVTVPVGGKPMPPAAVPDPKKLRERWNDYGIGFLLQGDFKRATRAFQQVTKLAPQWPEGWVNVGRVRLQEGALNDARQAFETALRLYEVAPTPMTPLLRARTQFFYAQTLRNLGQYDPASEMLKRVLMVFPHDRNVHNELGQILFREARFDEAIHEFQETLRIDPEDLTAHYQLMLCYRGKGDEGRAQQHQQLYYRFKADETASQIRGPYERAHPYDNNEAQPVHEHEG